MRVTLDVITCSCLIMVVSFILTATKSIYSELNVQLDIYDPSGNPTLILYDGGEIRIICIFKFQGSGHMRISSSVDGVEKVNRIMANKTSNMIKHSVSLSHKVLHWNYACVKGDEEKSIVINYMLCNPKKMPPIDCTEPKEYCHITAKDTPQCRRLEAKDCRSSKGSLKFKHICSSSKGELSKHGLCSALARIDESDINSVASGECKLTVTFYLIANGAAKKQIIYMNRRVYINVKYPFNIGAVGSLNGYSMTFNTTVDDTVIFTERTFESSYLNYTLSVMVKKIQKVDQPANISMTCRSLKQKPGDVENYENYFSAQLLVFNPDKDLHINITGEKPAMVGDKALKKININVTAAEGLYACVKKGIGRCAPVGANRSEIVKAILEYKPSGGENFTTYFYVGLFTSSPKQRHVLLHQKIISHTVQGSAVPAVNAGDANTAGFTAGIVILTLICVILIVVIVAISMLWWKSARSSEKSEAIRVDPVIREKADTEHQSQYGITNTKSYSLKKSNRFASAACETYSG